jgi:colicin import membrane protein
MFTFTGIPNKTEKGKTVSAEKVKTFEDAKAKHLEALNNFDKARLTADNAKAAKAAADRKAKDAASEARKAEAKIKSAKDPKAKQAAVEAAQQAKARAAQAKAQAAEVNAAFQKANAEKSAAEKKALEAAKDRGMAANQSLGGPGDPDSNQTTKAYMHATPETACQDGSHAETSEGNSEAETS